MPSSNLLRNDRSARFGKAAAPPPSLPAAAEALPSADPHRAVRHDDASRAKNVNVPAASEHTEAAASGLTHTNL